MNEQMLQEMTAELMINHPNLNLGRAREIAEEIAKDIDNRVKKGFHIPVVTERPKWLE
tara:strand:+ start:227 stop:400 length:174 start_codon:yes stop_codon:yes gene_type:complete